MEYDNYMVTCDICGCEFDIENSGCCDCGFGCGGGQVKCPRCGLHMPLPDDIRDERKREYDANTVFAKMEAKLAEIEEKEDKQDE
ncbi:MAG: hypothetical protein SOZ23_06890 [Methanosphaera sp.]|uniref:hypothetical protein n=1 Tax=Methanosphaera sp. TaxID=2666342 RepID=UPI0025D80DF1|nr:hypothetical protein [Methanosphaera sp.]MCI5867715.1 hypothetical protein [Methanosphaera sp.]MDD6535325.1 hypothetical protein [Methanosphaera sp.]MDY3956487.1 hypothetical protein [Methanosphaera sp.]